MAEQSNLWNEYTALAIFLFTTYTFMRDLVDVTTRANAILAISYSILFIIGTIAMVVILKRVHLIKRPNELK